MNTTDLYFISSAWNTGTGFKVDGYNFIITTVKTTGFANYVVIKNKLNIKKIAKVIFVDYSIGLAFLEDVFRQNSSIKISDFEMSIIDQPANLFITNYFNETKKILVETLNTNIRENNTTFLKLKGFEKKECSGAVLINNKKEFIGISLRKNNQCLVLPAKYILKSMEEYSSIGDVAIRCTNCLNIIKTDKINDNTCYICGGHIIPQLIEDTIPSLSKTDLKIENIITSLGFNINLARLGQHFWEIQKGSATIFIRYQPKLKFIVAFSVLCSINPNFPEIYKFLINENSKLKFLSFSINNTRIFLSTPYLVDENFNQNFATNLFSQLFDKADFYDDILINMQNK